MHIMIYLYEISNIACFGTCLHVYVCTCYADRLLNLLGTQSGDVFEGLCPKDEKFAILLQYLHRSFSAFGIPPTQYLEILLDFHFT